MNGLIIAIKSELFQGIRSFSSKLIVFAPALITTLQLLIVSIGQTSGDARDALTGGNGFESALESNAYGYFVDGLLTGLIILGLLLVALSAHSLSNDRETGVIRHLLIRRCSRSSVVVGKVIYLHLLCLASLVTLFLVTYFVSSNLWEFGPIVEDGFELIGEEEIRNEISLGLRLALLPLPAAITFGMLVSVITQTTTQAITTALGITLAVDVFKASLGDFSLYIYASFQPSLIDQSYLQDVSRLVRGYSDVLVDERFLEMNTWTPIPALLVFVVLSLIIVQRIKV